ncbi:hypothetical protein DSL64_28365 [Dyadobacter luteus]|uniref:Uncharacterized protein n=1 Tax=Dyadobacter luteus TaxID=2259619 RepID=A0A3D8Y285_9BACT|nr:hypothetical protein DSL64_28365 [Dyadobacter luteus]
MEVPAILSKTIYSLRSYFQRSKNPIISNLQVLMNPMNLWIDFWLDATFGTETEIAQQMLKMKKHLTISC